jgi:hypothetical protein
VIEFFFPWLLEDLMSIADLYTFVTKSSYSLAEEMKKKYGTKRGHEE